MRYDIKTGQIEISVGELCPERHGRLRPDDGSGSDIVPAMLPEICAGGAPRDVVLCEMFEGIDFRISGRADAVVIDIGGGEAVSGGANAKKQKRHQGQRGFRRQGETARRKAFSRTTRPCVLRICSAG